MCSLPYLVFDDIIKEVLCAHGQLAYRTKNVNACSNQRHIPCNSIPRGYHVFCRACGSRDEGRSARHRRVWAGANRGRHDIKLDFRDKLFHTARHTPHLAHLLHDLETKPGARTRMPGRGVRAPQSLPHDRAYHPPHIICVRQLLFELGQPLFAQHSADVFAQLHHQFQVARRGQQSRASTLWIPVVTVTFIAFPRRDHLFMFP